MNAPEPFSKPEPRRALAEMKAFVLSTAEARAYIGEQALRLFDGPRDPANAIKPTTMQSDHRLLCIDGQPPIDWRCPDQERL